MAWTASGIYKPDPGYYAPYSSFGAVTRAPDYSSVAIPSGARPDLAGSWTPQSWPDLTKPGAAETYWNQTGSQYQSPFAGENWWAANQGAFLGPYAGDQYVSGALARYGTNMPLPTNNAGSYYTNTLARYGGGGSVPLPTNLAGSYYSSVGLPFVSGPGQAEQYARMAVAKYANNAPLPSNVSSSTYNQFLPQLTGPGMGESYTRQVLGQYAGGVPLSGNEALAYMNRISPMLYSPGTAERFGVQTLGRYEGGADVPVGTNLARGAYGQTLQAEPDLMEDPSLAPFFENAKRRSAEDINAEMAARGLWGSTAATDRVSEAFTDLDAERALREAEYVLARSAEQRGWRGLAGEQARASDISAATQAEQEMMWQDVLRSIAADAQGLGLERGRLGLGAAEAADVAAARRVEQEQGWTDILTSAAQQAQALGLDRAQTAAMLGELADRASLARVQAEQGWVGLLGDITGQAQQLGISRVGLGGDLARAGDVSSLARTQMERDWVDTFGNLARQGDISSLARTEAERGWVDTLANMGLRSDEQRAGRLRTAGDLSLGVGNQTLSRLLGGQTAATAAQNAQRQRIGDMLDQQWLEANTLGGIAGQTYDDIITSDISLLEAEISASLGMSSQALQAAYQKQIAEGKTTQTYMDFLAAMYRTAKEVA